jgi:hypothetical protein
MLHLPATGELLDVKALEWGEILRLNEAGHLLQWGVDIGLYTPQETPEEYGLHNIHLREMHRINAQAEGSTLDRPPYPLSIQEKNTVLAALFHYHKEGRGEPFNRLNEVHALASGEADDLQEDISVDQNGVSELLNQLGKSDGIKIPALLHLRRFAEWIAVYQSRAVTYSSKDEAERLSTPDRIALLPVAFDPKELSDHDLCLALEEMRRGWAVAAYDVSNLEALISEDVAPAPTDEEIRAWLQNNQDELQHGMCAAMPPTSEESFCDGFRRKSSASVR